MLVVETEPSRDSQHWESTPSVHRHRTAHTTQHINGARANWASFGYSPPTSRKMSRVCGESNIFVHLRKEVGGWTYMHVRRVDHN